jgi:hypothetical protein
MTKDPRYPNRPDHADFERLSKVLIANDDGSDELEEIVADVIDVPTVMYAATQRVLRAEAAPSAKSIALWLDGFMAGARYEAALIGEISRELGE